MNEQKKRELIFSAVLELVKQNKSFANLKVSDIAKQAGIGKGSIYMYFSSKERVIVDAIRYFCDMSLKPFLNYDINEDKGFEETLKGLIELQIDMFQEYAYLLSPTNNHEFISIFDSNALPETIEIAKETRQKYIEVLGKVLQLGVHEKVLSYVNIYSINVAAEAIMIVTRYHAFKDTKFVDLKEDYPKEYLIQTVCDMIKRICK